MTTPPRQVVLMEYAMPPEAEAEAIARRIDRCLELRGARWMRSYVSADGRRALCEFEAPDAESVREAFRSAGQPFDRAWVAQVYARDG
ncbi:MAG TPA: DUF4242 domain-containing protein [Anaeromyxobacter sp.]|nr:DUF4242 domain-containing protein [Anaeromyxobacter sp.]